MNIKLFLLLNNYEHPGINKHLIFFNIYQGADLLGNVAILLKLFLRKGNTLSTFPLVYMKVLFFPYWTYSSFL